MKAPDGFVVLREGTIVRRGHEEEIDAFLAAAASHAGTGGGVAADGVHGGRGATRLVALRDGGALSDTEFEAEKAKLMGEGGGT